MEILHQCTWLQDSPWVGVGVRWGLRRREMKAEASSGETRSVEECRRVRHTWAGGYPLSIWGGAACGSRVSRFPDARLPASGLGSLNAFDSPGVAITLVVCLGLALQGWRKKMETEITFHLTVLPTQLFRVLGWSHQDAGTLPLHRRAMKACLLLGLTPGRPSYSWGSDQLLKFELRLHPLPHPEPGC